MIFFSMSRTDSPVSIAVELARLLTRLRSDRFSSLRCGLVAESDFVFMAAIIALY